MIAPVVAVASSAVAAGPVAAEVEVVSTARFGRIAAAAAASASASAVVVVVGAAAAAAAADTDVDAAAVAVAVAADMRDADCGWATARTAVASSGSDA